MSFWCGWMLIDKKKANSFQLPKLNVTSLVSGNLVTRASRMLPALNTLANARS